MRSAIGSYAEQPPIRPAPLIALVPARPVDAPMPDAAQTQADAAEDEEEAPPQQVQLVETTGTWERSSEGGRETVTLTSAEGEPLFWATCMVADTRFGDLVVQIKAALREDTVGAIDIFTSAGNARVPAGRDMSPDLAAGMTETVSQPSHVLASGAVEMPVVSGIGGIVFETDPMLKSLIRDGQPEYSTDAPATAADGDDETDADAKEAPDTKS